MTSFPEPSDARVLQRSLHRVQAALRGRLLRAQAGPDAAFARAFPAMVDAVEAALRHEEQLLESLCDGGLRARRAENAQILCALHRVAAQVEDGAVALGRQIAAAIADVLDGHRLADAPAPALPAVRAQGRRRPARSARRCR